MNTQIVPQQARPVPPGAIDVWSQSQNQQLGFVGPPSQPVSPVAKVQRLLRGRVIVAIVLAILCGAAGAAVGFMSQAPMYRSQGLLQINPTIPLPEDDARVPYYQQFMATQALKIASPAVLSNVPKVDPWKSSEYANDEASLAALGSGLKTEYRKNTFNISIQYDDVDQKRAAFGVQSVIEAFKSQYKTESTDQLQRKIRDLEAKQRDLEAQKRSSEALITAITAKYGSPELEPRVAAAQRDVEEIGRELRGYENNLRAAVTAIDAMRNGGGKTPIEELAQVDATLAEYLANISQLRLQLQRVEAAQGKNHPAARDLRTQIEVLTRAAEEYADTLRKEILAVIPDFVSGNNKQIKITPGQLRVLEARVAQLRNDVTLATKARDEIAADAGKVATYRLQIKNSERDMEQVVDALNKMRFAEVATGELQVMQNGSYATKTTDKKVMFGLLGAMVGGALPIGLLLMLGLMDTRFRYSDDAAGNAMSGIPLLGILPNLPDRLSDPAQASIAAHCVHQIRTMLQLNAMREGSTVFSITSASSGDGKTSLSLALGLSFAASGSRTLLIDADLVGGGLTSRLGNAAPLGIVDALAGVKMDDCVQATDVADLSILPIGSAQAHHAGGFSPPAVRKLLGEARKRYEVIIIDTGPVMGSIEATPICASVDGVVLTVARGQSRPLVERAIQHLTSIGARVAGVVFNRAQHKDFEQSIGAISIRSAARSAVNGSGHNARNPGDIGAVAKAVATSVRSDN